MPSLRIEERKASQQLVLVTDYRLLRKLPALRGKKGKQGRPQPGTK